MLKIKDNVDLKELEKFGFKPKYDEYTGELNEYFFINRQETGLSNGWGINIKKVESNTRKCRILYRFKRNKYGFPDIESNKIWMIDNYRFDFLDFDKLYDLIKADMVEKVEV